MPKIKTKKAVAKKFKVTANGKLKCNQSGRSHLMSSKSGKRKRQLREERVFTGPEKKALKHMMGK